MHRARTNPSARERLLLIAIAVTISLGWAGFTWLAVRLGMPSWSRRIPFIVFLLPAPIALVARYLRGGWDAPILDVDRRKRFEAALLRSWRLVMWGGVAAYAGYLAVNFVASIFISRASLVWFGGIPGVLLMAIAPVVSRLGALVDIARSTRGAAGTLVARCDDSLVAVLANGERRTISWSANDRVVAGLALPARVRLVGGAPPPKPTAPYRDGRDLWTGVRVESAAVGTRRAMDAVASLLELSILWVPVAGWLATGAHELTRF